MHRHQQNLQPSHCRIFLIQELRELYLGLVAATKILKIGGILIIVSLHSLEDRIVKNFMRKESSDCLCPTSILVCQCNHTKKIELINKKVIKASAEEMVGNPRVRSARLRACVVI